MKRAALEEVVELHLLKTARGTKAFLVARGDVTGGGHTLSLGFGAFEDDDIAWHDVETWEAETSSIVVFVKRNRLGIFILDIISSTEANFIRWTETAIAILLLPLGLALNRKPGKRNRLQPRLRNLPRGHFAGSVSPL